jgi:holliday junction DNA helicase RuvA
MYAYIEGKLTVKEPAYMVVDVGGVGYYIKISLNTYSALKSAERAKLHTYLHVKEDIMVLYGFYEKSEKEVFLDLISISGVGPGTALLILSSLTPLELQEAILSGEAKRIQNVKGIGAKTAQRIILELKDKMAKGDLLGRTEVFMGVSHNTKRNEALTALTTLGINKAIAEKTLDSILKKGNGDITLEDLIKQALKTS